MEYHVAEGLAQYYRPPDIDDPIYRLEQICIAASALETRRSGGQVAPTFERKLGFIDRVLGRDAFYSCYPVPVERSLYWLWEVYRPTCWSDADNRSVVLIWTRLLYNLDRQRTIEVEAIIDGVVDPDPKPVKPWSLDDPIITNAERWGYAMGKLSQTLPFYG